MAAEIRKNAEVLAQNVKLIVFDVDGVMTDGGLHYDGEGRITKRYHVLDGVGLRLLRDGGIEVAVVTAGQDGPCVEERMKRLKIDAFYEGNMSKQQALEDLRARFGLDWNEMAYIGDDWVDLIPLSMVGLPMSVPNARKEVKACAVYITEAEGGNGAVREVAEWILTCQGKFDAILAEWTTPVAHS